MILVHVGEIIGWFADGGWATVTTPALLFTGWRVSHLLDPKRRTTKRAFRVLSTRAQAKLSPMRRAEYGQRVFENWATNYTAEKARVRREAAERWQKDWDEISPHAQLEKPKPRPSHVPGTLPATGIFPAAKNSYAQVLDSGDVVIVVPKRGALPARVMLSTGETVKVFDDWDGKHHTTCPYECDCPTGMRLPG